MQGEATDAAPDGVARREGGQGPHVNDAGHDSGSGPVADASGQGGSAAAIDPNDGHIEVQGGCSGDWESLANWGTVAIWGNTADDIFAVGAQSIWHYDGQNWSDMNCGAPCENLQGHDIWGRSSDDVYVADAQFNDPSTTLHLLHYDGTAWRTACLQDEAIISNPHFDWTAAGGYEATVHGIWGSPSGELFTVGRVLSDASSPLAPGMPMHSSGFLLRGVAGF